MAGVGVEHDVTMTVEEIVIVSMLPEPGEVDVGELDVVKGSVIEEDFEVVEEDVTVELL
jgi:hypothetical protein